MDSLKTRMPAGELGSRNDPSTVLATGSGGTSKAEDTSRAAGYVADLTQVNAPPPGPPIAKSSANFEGLDGATDPVQSVAKSGPGPTPPAPPTPDPVVPPPAGPARPGNLPKTAPVTKVAPVSARRDGP